MDLKDKKTLVFGCGKSGIGAALLLKKADACPYLYDGNTDLDREKVLAALGEGNEVPILLGDLDPEFINTLDLVVLSPGVPCDLPLVKAFYQAGLPVWSEVELAWQMTKGTVLAITGTNGKTTTTSLLGKIMSDARESVFVVGNIGTAYTSKCLETRPDSVTVAEISSFQLETIDTFAPKVSAILNITPDHLNRHHTMEEYIRVKERITENQSPEDTCVLNYEDEILRDFGNKTPVRVIWFSSLQTLEEGVFLDGDTIMLRLDGQTQPVVRVDELQILGRHNVENVMAAVAMAFAAGVDLESIRASVKAFKAVPHRIEFVAEKNGVAYYNDSKGTNPDAAIKGIQAMVRPTWLIGGGYDKQSDYGDWIRAFDGKVKMLILIGQTKHMIAKTARENGFTDILICEDLAEAVAEAAARAVPGDAVLLSPACASWGQFDNYEQRGDVFRQLVLDM